MRRRTFKFLGIAIAILLVMGWILLSPKGAQRVTYTPAAKECFSYGKWKACVYRAVQGTNGELAYFFHGRTLDENVWNDDTFYTAQIQNYWETHHTKPPTVVTFSLGPVWILTPKSHAVLSGQLDLFLNEAMPEIEKRIGVPKSRLIVGESMGGMNALTTGLIAPDRFRKIVALCPPLYRISPFSPWSEMLDFFRRTGGDPKTLLSVVELSKLYVENQAEWNRISPIKLIAALDPAHTPEIYLSCGLYDKYGNYEGAQDFAQTAIRRAFRIEWRPLFGGHCVSDVTSVAEAIAPSGLNLLTTTSR